MALRMRNLASKVVESYSKDAASLHSKKNWLGVRVFCEPCRKWRTFRPPWPTSPGPGTKLLDQLFSNFSAH